jgi:membrane protein DedA with SNARE-associated domain
MATSLSPALQSTLTEKRLAVEFQDIVNWMLDLSTQYGYLGIFLISLVGAMSIFVPIPVTVVTFTLGGLKSGDGWFFEPVLIAAAAGLGSAVGEFSAYLVGLGGRKAIGGRYKKKMDVLARVLKKWGMLAVFVFSLTPLPDDLIFIPLGVMHYNVSKIFVAALLGKFLMNLIVAYAGRFSMQTISRVFGVESTLASMLIGTVIAVVLLVVVLIIMLKVDWENYLGKYSVPQGESEV